MVCMPKRLGNEKSRLVLGLALAVAAMLLMACAGGPAQGERPPAKPTHEPGYSTSQTFNQSLTIDDVTMVMDSITHSGNHFAVEYSYSSGAPGVDPTQMIKGISLTRADGNLYYSDSPIVGEEVFPLYSRIPGGEGELVDVSLGTYMIPANVSGSVSIDLGMAHKKGYRASSRRAARGPITAPLNAEFWIGDRKYRVAKLVVFPTDFRLWIEPVNEAARRTVLTDATLTDNTGGIYKHVGGSTSFDDLSPRGHEWRQFRFIGIIPESKTALTLGIQGGETVVGPFVFEDVRVASDEAPAGATPGAGGAVDLGRGGVRWVAYPKE